MSQLHPFEQRLAEAWPPVSWRDVNVMLAVSGGADSVALLRALAALHRQPSFQQPAGQLAVAHFNHQLRGEESQEDERFVHALCERLRLPLEVGLPTPAGQLAHDRREDQLRRQRYQFFREAAGRRAARFVALAHTADDQAETVLHRIVRGTGLAGLAGIPATRRLSQLTTIIRPLLSFPRLTVREYLADLDQSFREDSSNRNLTFTRNRIRHGLLPQISRDFNPRASQALTRLGQLAGEAQEVIASLVKSLVDACVIDRSAELVRLDRSSLCRREPFLVRELMKEVWRLQGWPRQAMSEAKWRQLGRLAHDDADGPSSVTLPGAVQVTASGTVMELRCDVDPALRRASKSHEPPEDPPIT